MDAVLSGEHVGKYVLCLGLLYLSNDLLSVRVNSCCEQDDLKVLGQLLQDINQHGSVDNIVL